MYVVTVIYIINKKYYCCLDYKQTNKQKKGYLMLISFESFVDTNFTLSHNGEIHVLYSL